MDFLAKNLKYLREKKGLKQIELPDTIGFAQSTWNNYEKGKSNPNLLDLIKISKYFDIPETALLHSDLSKGNLIELPGKVQKGNVKGNPTGNLRTANLDINAPFKQGLNTDLVAHYEAAYGAKAPKVITLDNTGDENIISVPAQAYAGYLSGYSDPKFIAKLDSFKLPGLRGGTYRLFEVVGPSMSPTMQNNDRLICRWVENLSSIRENRVHVVVTNEGIVVKRVMNRIAQRGVLVMKSDTITHRKDYPTYELSPEIVNEVWYPVIKLTADFTEPAEIYHRMADLEADVTELRTINASFSKDIQEIRAILENSKH